MKIQNIVPRFRCKYQTNRADRHVRSYLGLDKKLKYAVVYDPDSGKLKRGKHVIDIGGSTNGYEIIYPDVPSLREAKHEVVHIYHIRTNPSLEGYLKNATNNLLSHLLRIIALESLAYSFDIVGGNKIKYKIKHNFEYDIGRELEEKDIREFRDMVLRDINKPFSVGLVDKLLDFSDFKPTDDSKNYDKLYEEKVAYLLQEKNTLAGNIARNIANFVLVRNFNQDLVIDTDLEVDPVQGLQSGRIEMSARFSLELLDEGTRRRWQREWFKMDYRRFGEWALGYHKTKIEPVLGKAAEELKKKIERL